MKPVTTLRDTDGTGLTGSELKVFGTPNVVVGWVALLLCIRGVQIQFSSGRKVLLTGFRDAVLASTVG